MFQEIHLSTTCIFFNLYQLDLQLSRCLTTLPVKSPQVMPDVAPGGGEPAPPLLSLP